MSEIFRPQALISGASRGIGAAIARKLASQGYDLILTCQNSMTDLEALALDLQNEFAVNCIARQVDMGDWNDVSALFDHISDLDVLVNNAGISYVGLLSEMDVQYWHRVMAVNSDSLFFTSKCAIPMMLRKQYGRIVNISSVWGNVGASMEVAYSASKGAVNSFTKALAKELAPSHISVNAIACGVINTSMNACFSAEDMELLRQEIPADRIGEPEEVAQMVWHIIQSPDYFTGQIVTIDGGWT